MKFKFKNALLAFAALAMVGGVGAGVALGHAGEAVETRAAEQPYKTVLFGSEYNSKGVSSYAAEWSVTCDQVTLNLQNWNNNNNGWKAVKCGSKNGVSVATMTTTGAFAEAITSVVVTVDACTASNINSTTLEVSSASDFSSVDETIAVAAASGNLVYTIENPAANKYYRYTVDCKKGSANGFFTVSKVAFRHEASAIALSTDSGILKNGSDLDISSYVDGETGTLSYESGDEEVAIVDENGVITAVSAGNTTVTVTDSGTETSASFGVFVAANAGTSSDPLSVEDARRIVDSGVLTSASSLDVYVSGIISQEPAWYDGSSSYTVYIKDSWGSSSEFQFFKMTGAEEDAIAVGDKLTAHGLASAFTLYKTTYELNGCVYASHIGKDVTGLSAVYSGGTIPVDGSVDTSLLTVTRVYNTGYSDGEELKFGTDYTIELDAATAGEKTATVKLISDETKTGTFQITVVDTPVLTIAVPAECTSALVGNSFGQFQTSWSKQGVEAEYSFTSSDPDVIQITNAQTGAYHVVAKTNSGTVTITCEALWEYGEDDGVAEAYLEVTAVMPDAVPTAITLLAEDKITGGTKGVKTAEIEYDVEYEWAAGTYGVNFVSSDEAVASIVGDPDPVNKVVTVLFHDNAPEGVTITATSLELGSVVASHTFIVTGLVDSLVYTKVTETPVDWTGSYLFVFEDEDDGYVFDGSLTALDVASDYRKVIIDGDEISLDDRSFTFDIAEVDGGVSIRAASGKYIGRGSDSNGMDTSDSALVNTIAFVNGNVDVIGAGGAHLCFNSTSNQMRFRYYKSSGYASQESIALYRAGTDDEIALNGFVGSNLHFDTVDPSDEGTGLCKTEGWYDEAKTAYNLLTADQKELFVTSVRFESAFARFSAWARANGEKFNATGEIVKAANNVAFGGMDTSASLAAIITVISIGAIAAAGMIILAKKRKRA